MHVPVNWRGRLISEGMEGLMGGESRHPDDNVLCGVQGKYVCIKINYSILSCIVLGPNRASWSMKHLPNISHCCNGSPDAV